VSSTPLPIEPVLPAIRDAVRERGVLVLQAEPGAGKTTRVPTALLEVVPGEVLVLEPRRLAARLAARRVAEERGERLGETIGFQVRFEQQVSARTRVRFVTEGILTRRLLRDPRLEGVSAVVLDEFHERHLEGDLALALLARLRVTERPDLALVVMSATLDAGPIATWLSAPVIAAPGRQHPVTIEHRGHGRDVPLEVAVARAVESLLDEGQGGDVLVFLPGAAEIRRAIEACASLRDVLLLPLHGSLPAEEQDRALRPASKRKVIFATNVAETSVTIEGVVAVIDSGLARMAGHSFWSGLPTLEVEPVSRASAKQRAGRAGRTRPGRCIRLYSASDHDARAAFTSPEIERLDLAGPVLELRAAGLDPRELRWLEPPPGAALEAAEALLSKLGALDARGVTALGEKLLRFPLHPRLARVLVEAGARGVGDRAATIAALLSERDVRTGRAPRAEGPSDVLALLASFEAARAQGFRGEGIDERAARAVERVREQLARISGAQGGGSEEALLRSILAGYPDRVAKRRGGELLMADGSTATLARESEVRNAPFVVAVDAQERLSGREAGAIVRSASAIEPDWLLDEFPEGVREVLDVTWDARTERVLVMSRLLYGVLVLDESAKGSPPPGEIERVLSHAALAAGPEAFADREELAQLAARAAFARTVSPAFPELGDAAARAALVALATGRRSFNELREAGLVRALTGGLSREERQAFERLAPEEVQLPGGRRVRVRYAAGQAPSIESRIQDFFGLAEGPRVGAGEVALVLHLNAPNNRAVQVTSDLAGFWVRHYPAIRRELSRRYPRHAWPEDPVHSRPPPPGGKKPR
jgi:ATP-dependent helicase HrpB